MSDDGIDFDELLSSTLGDKPVAHPETAALLEELDRKNRLRALVVPTNDIDVRAKLRSMGHPITLFGERPGDRRDRLRELISKEKQKQRAANAGADSESDSGDSGDSSDSELEKEFFTEGSQELLAERKWVAEYSLKR